MADHLKTQNSTEGQLTKESLRQIGDQLYNDISIQTRKYKFTDYKNVFLGSEAVEWLKTKSGLANSDEQAIEIGNQMIELGIFSHCVKDHKLINGEYFYRFRRDDKNRGRVPDSNGAPGLWKLSLKGKEGQLLNNKMIETSELNSVSDWHRKNEEIPDLLVDKHNAELLDSVRPIRWEDPEQEPIYNMVCIGAGAGGIITAIGVAGAGGKSAICEKNMMGGDCLNTGCVPSKALIKAAKIAHSARIASEYGVETGEIKVDFKKAMESVRIKRAKIGHHDSCERFIKTYGTDIFLGHAKFISEDTIEVNRKKLKFARACIASGGRPRVPKINGIDSIYFYTSENLFNLDDLPKTSVIIGGGPIGAEIGQSLQRLGSQVHFILRSGKFLSKEDPEAGTLMRKRLEAEGCQFHTFAKWDKISPVGEGTPLTYQKPSQCTVQLSRTRENLNKPVTINADCLILATGRVPNVLGMDLEKAKVKYDEKRGVHIGPTMRTTNPKIYAVGDCCHPLQFTHMADQMARGVARNACFFGSVKHTDFVIPRVTYTEPEIAQVGKNKIELAAEGIEFQEIEHRFSDNDRAICDGDTDGYIKMYVEKGKGTIYGCVIVANRAGEMISEVTLAMSNKLKLSAFSNTIHPYPTYGEGIRKVADKFNGQRLTPGTKAILRKLLKVRR